MDKNEDTLDETERFWLGPRNPERYVVYHMQRQYTQEMWTATPDGTEFDPNYSTFSIRIHDPKALSLSFINRTIAIIPKSRLRSIHNLIGEYLKEHDDNNDKKSV